MRKILISIFAFTLIFSGLTATSTVKAEMKKTPDVQLTTEQKAELSELYKAKQEIESKILDKYVQFKVLTEDQKVKIMEHKDKWFKVLEENGFVIPHHGHDNWQQAKPKF